jgi:hypothetical protein
MTPDSRIPLMSSWPGGGNQRLQDQGGMIMADIEYPDVRVQLTRTDGNACAIIGRVRRIADAPTP